MSYRYITSTKANSAFRPFGVSKSSTGLSGCGRVAFTCIKWQVGDSILQVTLHSSDVGFFL